MRAEGAVPPEAADRFAASRGDRVEHDFHCESESHPLQALHAGAAVEIRDVVRRHQIDGARAEESRAVQHAAVHEHLRELHVVLGSGPESAAAGEQRLRREPIGRLDALEIALLSAAVERDDALQAIFGWRERRVFHPQRIEDAALQELIERETRDEFDDAAERVDAFERAVAPLRARLEVERRAAKLRDVTGERVVRFARRDTVGFGGSPSAAREPGGVRHQIANRHLAIGWHRVDLGLGGRRPLRGGARRRQRLRHRDLHRLELRNEA